MRIFCLCDANGKVRIRVGTFGLTFIASAACWCKENDEYVAVLFED